MCQSTGSAPRGGSKALSAIQTNITKNFITPFNSQNDAASPYWVNALKDAIGREAFMRGYEITQQQVDAMADSIITKLPTAQEIRERFKRGSSQKQPELNYEPLPLAVLRGNGTKEEKAQRRETVTRFMENARVGDVYTQRGIGGSGEFEIVEDRKSPNGMGLKYINGRTSKVQMSRANVEKFISAGAHLKKRGNR